MDNDGVFGSGEMDPTSWAEPGEGGQSNSEPGEGQAPPNPEGQGQQQQAPDGQQQQEPQGQPEQQPPQQDGGEGQPAQEPAAQQQQQTPDQQIGANNYDELRRAYNQRDQEISSLRAENQQLYQYLQQVMQPQQQQQFQQPQQMVHGPASGQPPQPQQQPQQQPQIDPQQWWDDLQRRGPAAVQDMINSEVENRLQQVTQNVQQMFAPVYQHIQSGQIRDNIRGQLNKLARKYPDAGQHAESIMGVAQENPMLLTLPDGVERAYREAKLRAYESQNQQASRQAAQMPTGGSAQRPLQNQNQPSPDDQIRQKVFGAPQRAPGVFD